jgi:diguanylate cyclase (GGDEF)-like protein/PAS domain S-box-containing protein
MSARDSARQTGGLSDYRRLLKQSARGIVTVVCPVRWLRIGRALVILSEADHLDELLGLEWPRAEEELRLFHTIVQQSNDAIIVQSPSGVITQWNDGARRMYGYLAEEAIGRSASFLIPPGLREEADELLTEAIEVATRRTIHTSRLRKDGLPVHVSLTVAPLLAPDGSLLGVSTVARDITEQTRAHELLLKSERQLDDAQALAHVGSWELDLSQRRAVLSAELCRILGQPPGFAPTLEEFAACVYVDDRDSVLAGLRAAGEGHAGESEYRIVRPSGEIRYIHARQTPRLDITGRVTHLFAAVQDVTERKRDEARLEMLATHDPLTGLPNRRTFDDRIVSELARARRHDRHLSLALLDVDRFKKINDTMGHPVGDMVLAGVAQVLRNHIRGDEVIARVGGEEFAWILPDADAGGAQAAVRRCLAAVEAARFEGAPSVTVSAGICAAREGIDVVELYRLADDALLAAKHAGRNRIVVANGGFGDWGGPLVD